jgi:hypothetical protein
MVDISICNQAIALCGARSSLSSIDDDTPEALACRNYYDSTRIELLMAVSWPFARRQVALSLLDGTPEYGWDFTYLYPPDCLKPIFIHPSPVDVEDPFTNLGSIRDALDNLIIFVEGNKIDTYGNIQRTINTNKQNATLMYISNVISTQTFSADFRSLFIQTLAAKLGQAMVGNLQASQLQHTLSQQYLQRAIETYGNEYDKDRRPVIIDYLPTGLQARL